MKITKENSREDWQERVRECQESGLSRKKYCERENLSYWTFREWYRRIENENQEKFVKLTHDACTRFDRKTPIIKIIINDKISILIEEGFSGELLRQLIAELGVKI
jgi:hypothetical protein